MHKNRLTLIALSAIASLQEINTVEEGTSPERLRVVIDANQLNSFTQSVITEVPTYVQERRVGKKRSLKGQGTSDTPMPLVLGAKSTMLPAGKAQQMPNV